MNGTDAYPTGTIRESPEIPLMSAAAQAGRRGRGVAGGPEGQGRRSRAAVPWAGRSSAFARVIR